MKYLYKMNTFLSTKLQARSLRLFRFKSHTSTVMESLAKPACIIKVTSSGRLSVGGSMAEPRKQTNITTLICNKFLIQQLVIESHLFHKNTNFTFGATY